MIKFNFVAVEFFWILALKLIFLTIISLLKRVPIWCN